MSKPRKHVMLGAKKLSTRPGGFAKDKIHRREVPAEEVCRRARYVLQWKAVRAQRV